MTLDERPTASFASPRPALDPVTVGLFPERLSAIKFRLGAGSGPLGRPPRWALRTPTFAVLLAVLVLATVGLRLWHETSAFELFIDEVEYADLGNSFADGRGPELFGDPFFLHPPLVFALLGWVIGAPVPHMTVDFVLGLRWVNLFFAAANTLLVVGIARRVVPAWAALLAGVVYALDPFVIRFDSRLMLEAPMMTGILAGVLAALVAVDRGTRRGRVGWLAVAGLAFGVAVTTKSTSSLITSVPLLLMVATSWGLRRKEALGVFAVQCGTYVLYLLWVVITGRWGDWYEQTLSGVVRATGVVKETGFTAANAPSFFDRLLANLGLFTPSYLLIGVAVCYAVYLLMIGWRSLRVSGPGQPGVAGSHALRGDGDALGLLTCWLAGVLVAIVYTIALGTIEEQTFYLLAVPSTVVVALLATQLASFRRVLRGALAVALVLVLVGSGAVWWTVHSRPDDAYRRVSGYVNASIGTGSQIALGDGIAQFVLPGYGLHRLSSLDDARRTGSRYALVSTQLSDLGLAPASSAVVDELARRYTLLFSASGRTSGELRVYDLDRPLDGPSPLARGRPR